MGKKIIFLFILLVIVIVGILMSNKNKQPQESTLPKQERQNQQKIQTKEEKNPIDYFAPGYSNATKKINDLKKIRQQSFEENQKAIDEALNYNK